MAFKIPDTPEELFRSSGFNVNHFNKWIPVAIFFGALVVIALTSFYSIDPDEVGVIRTFGKYSRTTQPGLHWKMPFDIETLDKVKVKRVFKEEFGFRTLSAGVSTKYSSKNYNDESLMLTGDLNVLDVTWIVQFRIKDPILILFNSENPKATLRDISESVMREVIGDSSVSETLTTRRDEINQEVQRKLQAILDTYQLGIQIDTVKLQDVNPPEAVKSSFNEVNEAKQEREKVINQSVEAYNKVIPKAKGEAERTIREAEGYAISKIKKAEGDANRFLEVWKAYKEAKDVTLKRMYFDTLTNIIPKAGKVVISEPKANNYLPYFNLNEGGK